MNHEQADRVVRTLVEVFPRHGLDSDGLRRYGDALVECGADFDKASVIAERWPKTHPFFPSLAELLAVVSPRESAVADVDDVKIHPAVMARMTGMWREKMAEVDVKRTGRGPDGHWHGGPEPCPVEGGMKGVA